MRRLFAVTGKGGTGKTTLAALIIEYLVEHSLKPILAVDADSNSNLHMVLGQELSATIGGVREEMTEKTKKDQLPAGMSKQDLLEMQVEQALVETKDFDLVSMGRAEGPGCYCAINNMLRVFLDRMSEHYNYVVVDNEAGMEHLSRRTTQAVDVMFVVSDPSQRGLETAGRIRDLAVDMDIGVGKFLLVFSRVTGDVDDSLIEGARALDMEIAGVIPADPEVAALDVKGTPLLQLPADSIARLAVKAMMEKVMSNGGV